jgi:hypothetical protein
LKTIEHALIAGTNLTKAKQLAGHGRFGAFLHDCGINDRTARRYMQLAELAGAKSVVATDLNGLSIEGAIKRLAPPKAPKQPTNKINPAQPQKTNVEVCSYTDKLNSLAWADASVDARRHFVSAVGFEAWLEAMPAEWLPLIEQRLVRQHLAWVTISHEIPADLSIPQYLRRTPAEATEPTDTGPASEPATEVGEPPDKSMCSPTTVEARA